jgi:hypothetical protein
MKSKGGCHVENYPTGVAAACMEIEKIVSRARFSMLSIALGMDAYLHTQTRVIGRKAFLYLFISREIWDKVRKLNKFCLPENHKNAYLAYVNGPGKDWVVEMHELVDKEKKTYYEQLWEIYYLLADEFQPRRIALLYFALDLIAKKEHFDWCNIAASVAISDHAVFVDGNKIVQQ